MEPLNVAIDTNILPSFISDAEARDQATSMNYSVAVAECFYNFSNMIDSVHKTLQLGGAHMKLSLVHPSLQLREQENHLCPQFYG